MTPDQACKFKMPFGKHVGKTLEDITLIEKDVRYLDWLAGENPRSEVMQALKCFLVIPWVARMIEQAVEDHIYTGTGRTEPVENLRKPKNWWEK